VTRVRKSLGVRPRRQPTARERRLVDGLRARDPAALREIYAEWGQVTFGYLLSALDDRAAAEDIQQQVFLELWQRAEQYDPERGGLSTYLLTITRSRAADHLRRRVRERVELGARSELLDGPADADREDELLDQWRMAHLLRQLPVDQATLLRMRFYRGLTQTEIAAATGIPLGTVKSRMTAGLLQLREMLEGEDG